MIHRREVDGLRAVAVVPVVLFHAGLPGFAGGYGGVDVFFVISGFLITTLLLEDLAKDRFSILQFYERRARRILPALVLVVAVTTVAAALTLTPARLEEYGASMIATALFGANVYFWRTTDYFATAAEERPLLHMWSLAVEEQFYIVFPLLLLALWRWRKQGSDARLWAVFWGLAGVSFGLAVIGAGWKPAANFYLPVSRAWELLAGSLVALALKGAPPADTRLAPWLAGFGLLLVLGALIGIDDTTPWPGPWTLMPVLGTALILAFARPACLTGRLLGWGPLVWVGLLSYSIYLWHQPLLAFARILSPQAPSLALTGALGLATVPLAWLSWRFVEQPFRRRPAQGGISRRAIFLGSVTALLGLVAFGALPVVAPHVTETLYTARLSEAEAARYGVIRAVADPAQRMAVHQRVRGPCRARFDMVTPEAEQMLLRCTQGGARAVIITGGSHAIDLYAALAESSEGDVLIAFARGDCRPHRRLRGVQPHDCPFDGLRDLVATHADRIGLVLYTQAGFTLFDTYRDTRSADGLQRDLVEEVGDYLSALSVHVPVLALGPKPMLGGDPRRLSIARPLAAQLVDTHAPGTKAAFAAVDQAFGAALSARGVTYLTHGAAIGTVLPQEALVDGALTYRDRDHWSLFGARLFGARLVQALAGQGYGALLPASKH